MTFDEQFDELSRLAYRIAYRLLGNRAEAEEVAQEALIRAYVRWRRVHDHARAWVSRVATNLAIGVLRKRRPVPVPDVGEIDASDMVLERLDLQQRLLALPRRQREVVALRYLADLSEADVARGLGCSVGSVKRHARRGLDAMRRTLDVPVTEVL